MADSQTATSAPDFKSAHFIGIGGAGMSGIALVLHERGYVVTGSDLKTSRYIRQLTRAGVKVHVGHEAATIDEVKPDVVVVSTAIPESNPELSVRASWVFPCGLAQDALGSGPRLHHRRRRRYSRQDHDLFDVCHHARPHGSGPQLPDRWHC